MDAVLIEKEALKLTLQERALLADHLLQTLGGEDDRVMKAWADEAERRLGLFLSGEIEAFDGKSVVDSLRKGLG
ncbi:addiction module protein [Chlorobium sp. BLA1]|uniref:addiction module protein n=1 Tax=Candidatus Chlorobium masyuteum TaxID=2716876 RepID=UPI001421B18C|nr:addiction module protein [Candidatus Chlorobium masyuteum]NHQ59750.1 addiction module protein [Candidatus Chlorobium masyuteum]NTU44968.1 addiction module protein [Chlorobiaceae bacterium]